MKKNPKSLRKKRGGHAKTEDSVIFGKNYTSALLYEAGSLSSKNALHRG